MLLYFILYLQSLPSEKLFLTFWQRKFLLLCLHWKEQGHPKTKGQECL